MIDFLKSWKTNVVAIVAVAIGILNSILPDYADLWTQIQTFLIGVLAFLVKDADKDVNP
jgi:hypothetical protein